MRGQGEDSKGIKCCMCGDSGLSHELLLCRSCRLRSQHRYCSNIYPNSDSYDICNWCLDKSHQSSSNTSFRPRTNRVLMVRKRNTDEKSSGVIVKRPKRVVSSAGDDLNGGVNGKSFSLSSSGTKNGGGRLRRIIRKRKLEEISNRSNGSNTRVIVKNGFRNIKARKYKHLDEVSN